MKTLQVILIFLSVLSLPGRGVAQQRAGDDEDSDTGDKQPPPQESDYDFELEAIGQLFLDKGELSKALQVFDELRQANPDNLDLLETSISLCQQIASCASELQRRFGHLRRFIERNPKSVLARELLLSFAQDGNDPKETQRAIEGLIHSNPKMLAHRLLLVELFEDQKRERELDRLLFNLVKLFPKSSQLWVRVAERAIDIDNEKAANHALKMSKPYLPPLSKVKTKNEFRNRWMAVREDIDARVYERTEARNRDFRQDTRWADLEDDFVRSSYP